MSDNDQPTKHETEAGREFTVYAHGGVDAEGELAIATNPEECVELIAILALAIARGKASEVAERAEAAKLTHSRACACERCRG